MERFWSKVDKAGLWDCWVWQAHITKGGYGTFRVGKRRVTAHSFSYQLLHGEVPPGMEVDHLCRNRACVNPVHLEAVTHAENMRRGNAPTMVAHRNGVCFKGHAMTPENTKLAKTGIRSCRTCYNAWVRAWKQRRRG